MGLRVEQKQEIAEELARRLETAGTVYLTDFTGLDVAAINELRRKLQAEGAEYTVVKNTLALRALEGLGYPEDVASHFAGPTALVLAADDPVIPAKVVKEFAKEHEDRPVVKVGVVDRRTVPAENVSKLADLPPHEELLASIAGSLTAAVSGIAGVLEAVVRDIALLAEEVAKKREAGGEG